MNASFSTGPRCCVLVVYGLIVLVAAGLLAQDPPAQKSPADDYYQEALLFENGFLYRRLLPHDLCFAQRGGGKWELATVIQQRPDGYTVRFQGDVLQEATRDKVCAPQFGSTGKVLVHDRVEETDRAAVLWHTVVNISSVRFDDNTEQRVHISQLRSNSRPGLALQDYVSYRQLLHYPNYVLARSADGYYYQGFLRTLAQDACAVFLPAKNRVEIVHPNHVRTDFLLAGTKVEARWPGTDRYYPATIKNIRGSDGALELAYDDGDTGITFPFRVRVQLDEAVTPPGEAPAASPRINPVIGVGAARERRLVPGDPALAQAGDGLWYFAEIVSQEANGYTVRTHDAQTRQFPREKVCGVAFKAMGVVYADYQGKGKYYPGIIVASRDGLHDVLYADGDQELVPIERLASVAPIFPDDYLEFSSDDDFYDFVLAEKPDGYYYYGALLRVETGDSFLVNTDQGNWTAHVSRMHHRLVARPGIKLEADWQGKGKYYAATIETIDFTKGRLAVVYEDGTRETLDWPQVRFKFAAKPEIATPAPAEPPVIIPAKDNVIARALLPYDLVFAQYDDGRWYGATITAVDDDGYTIRYVDGVRRKLPAEKVGVAQVLPGEPIRANYQGQGKYYPGSVVRISGLMVDVKYDDGERETTTLLHLEKLERPERSTLQFRRAPIAGAGPLMVFARSADNGYYYLAKTLGPKGEESVEVEFFIDSVRETVHVDQLRDDIATLGMKVESNYQGQGRYYAGIIQSRTSDADSPRLTILYDDGKRETVSLERLRFKVPEE